MCGCQRQVPSSTREIVTISPSSAQCVCGVHASYDEHSFPEELEGIVRAISADLFSMLIFSNRFQLDVDDLVSRSAFRTGIQRIHGAN